MKQQLVVKHWIKQTYQVAFDQALSMFKQLRNVEISWLKDTKLGEQ